MPENADIKCGAEETKTDPRAGWWQAFFERSEDAQIVCERNGKILELNSAARDLLRIPPDAPCAELRLSDSFVPQTRGAVVALLNALSSPSSMPCAVLQLPGDPVVDVTVLALDARRSLVTLKSANARLHLESQLVRLMKAINATPDVFLLADVSFSIVFVNAAFQSVTGHPCESALGQNVSFLCAPESQNALFDCCAQVAQGAEWSGELMYRRADGSVLPVDVVACPVHDSSGQPLGYFFVQRDITARKALEVDVKRERDFALNIINSFDAAVYVTDRECRLTHFNQAWQRFPSEHGGLKREREPAIGANLLSWFADESGRATMKRRFQEVIASQRSDEFRTESDGRQWLVKISPCIHGGDVTGLIYSVADATAFYQLQQQLYQAQKMETIGALAAGIAHDFNNLLQAILGHTGLLMLDDETLPAETRDSLKHISDAAERATEITKRLLSFTRVSDESSCTMDLNEVVSEVTTIVQRSNRARITLEVQMSPAPALVFMDSTRAHQVLLNLCVNAQDAMPDGGKLTLSTAEVALTASQAEARNLKAGERFIRCSVSDTGSGIPKEALARVFDPFFTTKKKSKGTGLGLAIVQSIVTQAHGFIEVETEEGRGTTFHVFLPKSDEEVEVVEQSDAPIGRSNCGRILVVDDVDLVREFTKEFLQEVGFEVLVAPDAAAALETLEKQPEVDLVLTDYSMPGMNGAQLVQEIATRYPAMRCMVVSGYLEPEEHSFVERMGARILQKPFVMSEALQAIQNVLASPRQTAKEPQVAAACSDTDAVYGI